MNDEVFPEMRRRDFLAYGSAGAFSLACTASRAGAIPCIASQMKPTESQIAVGYVPGSERLVRGEQSIDPPELPGAEAYVPLHPHLMAAEALPQGDPHFARHGARLSIHGMFPFEVHTMYPDLALWAIDVEFKALRCTPMFYAWCYQNRTVPQTSSSSLFVVPVVDALNLTLSLQHTSDADQEWSSLASHRLVAASPEQTAAIDQVDNLAACTQQTRLEFSLGREAGIPKLRRGVYIIALPSARTGALPRWNEYQLRAVNPENPHSATELYRRNRLSHELVLSDFAYVKLVVDYAENASLSPVWSKRQSNV